MSQSANLGATIRKGTAWLFFGNTSMQVLNFLVGIVLARLLAPADFGVLATISIFTGIAGFIAGGGMGQALVRAGEPTKEDYDIVFTLQFIIGCLIYAVLFTIAPWFAEWYSTPLYGDLLRISALSFIFRPFVNLPGSILHRDMRFKAKSVVSVVSLVVTSALSIGMAYAGYGVWSLIAGGLAGSVVSMSLLIPLAKWRPGFSTDFRRGKDIARYGMLVTIGDFIVYLRGQASTFILSRTLGPHALGLFNKANSLALIPHGQITGSVYQVTFRALAKEQDNLDLSQYIYLRSITLVSIYTWPAFVALGWLALPLIRFIYGDKWVDAAPAITWFAIIGPFIMLEILAGAVLSARNWLAREIPIQISQLIIVTLGVLAGLPYGLKGVAIGASLSNIYGAVHMTWLASRCLSMPMWQVAKALWPPLLLNLAILLLWIVLEATVASRGNYGDFSYLVMMLGSGGVLYLLLFFLSPIPGMEAEKQRWISLVKNILPLKT